MGVKKRDAYFDNAKFILILLVVIGHFLEPLVKENLLSRSVYLLFYSFHMPAFVLISGFFSKVDKSPFKLKLIMKFLVPYISFQLLFLIFAYFVLPNQYDLSLTRMLFPAYIYWFLPALFAWNLLLPIFVGIGKKYSLMIAFSIGILSGYVDFIDGKLTISRVLVFLPFFLLGFFLTNDDFEKFRDLLNKKIVVTICGVLFALCVVIGPFIDHRWLWGYLPYSLLQSTEWYAGVYRIVLYLIAIGMIVAFFSFVPDKNTFYTKFGTRTLTVYLLHGFIVKEFFVLFPFNNFNSVLGSIILILTAVLLTLLLSFKGVTKLFNPIISPKLIKVKSNQ